LDFRLHQIASSRGNIPFVKQLKYLGSIVSSDIMDDPEV
jgi:hypothetical protein